MSLISKISLKSNPTIINFEDENATLYNKVEICDSIFTYYPFGEIQLDDRSGYIQEGIFYIEGLEFKLKLGSSELDSNPDREVKEIEHDFIWYSEQMPNPIFSGGKVTGTLLWTFSSKFRKFDRKKNKSYKGSIKSIIDEVLGVQGGNYGLDYSPATTFEIPVNNGIYYQSNQTDAEFIRDTLSRQAYSITNSTSPYYTFVNLNNEFYFATIDELFKRQQPVCKFTFLDGDESGGLNDYKVLSFVQNFGGYSINKDVYSQDVYKFKEEWETEKENLSDRVYKGIKNLGKITAFKTDVLGKTYSQVEFGMENDELFDSFNYEGFKNSQFRNSLINYRMTIQASYTPEAVSGKLVELEMKSAIGDSLSTEFSGNWLVIESKHGYKNEGSCVPISQLTLVKPSIEIKPDNPYASRFLG